MARRPSRNQRKLTRVGASLKQPGSAPLFSLLSAKADDCDNKNEPASANHPDRTVAREPHSAAGKPSVERKHAPRCEEPPKAKSTKKRYSQHVTCGHHGYLPNGRRQPRQAAAIDVRRQTGVNGWLLLAARCGSVTSWGGASSRRLNGEPKQLPPTDAVVAPLPSERGLF